jgi:hypothetical protein
MKQIKVVARGKLTTVDPNPDPNNALVEGGIINVSFNEPITIEAGSRIALDKFYCHLTLEDVAPPDPELYPAPPTNNIEELKRYPDLAIEMSSLDLETYDSDRRGRRNVVSYFIASQYDIDEIDKGGFMYEAKTLSYLSINNEMDIDMGTVVFRVVNIATGKPLKADYCSFNLLIA